MPMYHYFFLQISLNWHLIQQVQTKTSFSLASLHFYCEFSGFLWVNQKYTNFADTNTNVSDPRDLPLASSPLGIRHSKQLAV